MKVVAGGGVVWRGGKEGWGSGGKEVWGWLAANIG